MDDDTTVDGTETPATTATDARNTDEPEKVEGEESGVDYDETDSEGDFDSEEEYVESSHITSEYEGLSEGEEFMGEEVPGEHVEGEEKQKEVLGEEIGEEEFVEEPPPDPAAPFNFSDSKEALKEPFELRQDQLVEVELLWELYQNYTPAYTDLDNYITEKELAYMLKALLLMTYTPEQFMECIEFCVRPPHPEGHINYEQYLKIVTIRQRDFLVEDELRAALQVFDPDKTGVIDREYLKETLAKEGHKMPQKQLDNLIKEVDISNDGTIGIEDVVGTMCIDLNPEDIQMLRDTLNPPTVLPPLEDM